MSYRIEAKVMKTTIKRQCVYVVAVTAVLSLYAAGAYRIEQMRQTPRMAVVCTLGHCVPTDATLICQASPFCDESQSTPSGHPQHFVCADDGRLPQCAGSDHCRGLDAGHLCTIPRFRPARLGDLGLYGRAYGGRTDLRQVGGFVRPPSIDALWPGHVYPRLAVLRPGPEHGTTGAGAGAARHRRGRDGFAASVAGPVLGGFMTEYLSWRWVFIINLPLGLAAWWVARKTLVGLPVPQRKPVIDYLGTVLMIIGLTALLLGITEIGQGHSWRDESVLMQLSVALLALRRALLVHDLLHQFSGHLADRAAAVAVSDRHGRSFDEPVHGVDRHRQRTAIPDFAGGHAEFGGATSTTNLFRSLGGAVGVATMSALLLAMLAGSGIAEVGGSMAEGSGNLLMDSLNAASGPALGLLRGQLSMTFQHLLMGSAAVSLLGLAAALAMPNNVLRGRHDKDR
nr:hypothetical protein [Tanacetum cinerariifolium]